jgi:type I site-specific restriction endonuclease
MPLNESQTRALLIDPMLRTAGWRLDDKTQVDTEIPVDGYDKEPWNGVTDYCLFDPTGDVLAVVEAKRSSRNPREAYERTALRGALLPLPRRQTRAVRRLSIRADSSITDCFHKASS